MRPIISFIDRITTETKKDNSTQGRPNAPQYKIVHYGTLNMRRYYVRACNTLDSITYDISFKKEERISVIVKMLPGKVGTQHDIYTAEVTEERIELFGELLAYIVMNARANGFRHYFLQFTEQVAQLILTALQIQCFHVSDPMLNIYGATKDLEPLRFPPAIQYKRSANVRYFDYQGQTYFIDKQESTGSYVYIAAVETRYCKVKVNINHCINFTEFTIQACAAEVLQTLIEWILIDSFMMGARECFSSIPVSEHDAIIKQAMEGAGVTVYPVGDELQLCLKV